MAREKSEKMWIFGGVGASLLVAFGAWTFAVSPTLDDAASIRSQTADITTQNLALQSDVSRLQQQYAHIDRMRSALAIARAALPNELALSQFTDQINAQANANRLAVTSMTAGAPVAAAGATAVPAAGSTDGTSPSAAPTPTGTTSAASAGGLYSIPITLVVSGSVRDELNFIHAVQRDGTRAALVTTTTMATDTSNKGATSMSVNLQVFVAAAAPVAPAGATPTPSPTSTG